MAAPLLVALDTAGDLCSVAVRGTHGDRTAREVVGTRHSERLLPLLDAVLHDAGVALAAVDAIAFGAGPGSFTGLRVACAVAQGLGVGLGKPLLAVGNLDALAARIARRRPGVRLLVACDARMNEAYWAVYDATAESPGVVARTPPGLAALGELAALATAHGPALLVLDRIAAAALGGYDGDWIAAEPVDAGDLLPLAEVAWRAGHALPAAQAAPLYVRDRVALTLAERRAQRAAA